MGRKKIKKTSEYIMTQKRIRAVFIIFAVLTVLLCLRLANIQIVDSDYYTELAINQQTKDDLIEANRGSILDRNGKELAVSATSYNLYVDVNTLRKNIKSSEDEMYYDKLVNKLSKILKMKKSTIKKTIDNNPTGVVLAKGLSKAQKNKVRKIKENSITFSESKKRYYPNGNFASQLLGSVTEDNNGRSGLELEYDQYLSGLPGRWIKNTDNNGSELDSGTKEYYAAENGSNLVLTIDEVIQHYVENAIKKAMKTTESDKIMAIAMNPETAEVLAMAATPGFDPNNATKPSDEKEYNKFKKMSNKKQLDYLYKMWRNPLVNDTYEPGSTFKLITSSSSLESGVVNTTESFYCSNHIQVGGYTLHCAENKRHGDQLLRDAVANSCNTVHVQLALRLGAERFYDFISAYGFTSITGIDYPGEVSAQIQDEENLSKVSLATMGFGQGIAVTPIQLITAVCAIGNDGVIMQPRLVKALQDEDGNIIKEFKPKKLRRVISEETASEMCKIMAYEVQTGTGRKAAVAGYRVGGKTGTADQISSDGSYGKRQCTSFMCMAPMDDPKFALLVICDNPKEGSFGSTTAVPIAKEILENSLKYLEIEPVFSSNEKKENEDLNTKVPNITGKDLKKAKSMIEKKDLKYIVTGDKDKVVDQYPKAGTKVAKDSTVIIYTE
ncbi:MAG: PASTA domain-containing protein [Clostridia bacterium]|nr:PASTA domain-containing protein [Clostridia bacterium]